MVEAFPRGGVVISNLLVGVHSGSSVAVPNNSYGSRGKKSI